MKMIVDYFLDMIDGLVDDAAVVLVPLVASAAAKTLEMLSASFNSTSASTCMRKDPAIHARRSC